MVTKSPSDFLLCGFPGCAVHRGVQRWHCFLSSVLLRTLAVRIPLAYPRTSQENTCCRDDTVKFRSELFVANMEKCRLNDSKVQWPRDWAAIPPRALPIAKGYCRKMSTIRATDWITTVEISGIREEMGRCFFARVFLASSQIISSWQLLGYSSWGEFPLSKYF